MKKTSTRLASLGGIVVLGACAIALAQHDSRNRERDPIRPADMPTQQAEPIEVVGDWMSPFDTGHEHTPPTIVRASKEPIESFRLSDEPSANPLRESVVEEIALPEFEPQGVQLAATPIVGRLTAEFADYQQGPESPGVTLVSGEIPQHPPTWLDNHSPGTRLTSPEIPANQNKVPSVESSPSSQVARPNAAEVALPNAVPQNLPLPGTAPNYHSPYGTGASVPGQPMAANVPSTNALATHRAPPELPTLAIPPANMPREQARQISDLSDTQRGAMAPTDLGMPSSGLEAKGIAAYPSASGPAPTAPLQSFSNQYPTPNRPDYMSNEVQGTASLPVAGQIPGSARVDSTQASPSLGQPYAGLPNSIASADVADAQQPNRLNTEPTLSHSPTAADWPASSISNSQTPVARATLVSNQPGNRYLDGSQNPILLIQKRAPEEIQVGKRATFAVTVRNAGSATAHDVTVVDSVPRGARFVESVPATRPSAQGILTWNLGEIAAGEERTITLQIVPEVQGEVGSVATVHFAAQASVRTVATLPKLELELESQSEVLIGDVQQIHVFIRNTGTGVARSVRLEADIPPELQHESGDAQLEAVIGDLRPNENRRISLAVSAVQPGQSECAVRAISDDGITAEERASVDVRAPRLVAAIEGPKLRYLERQANYRITVQNTGTAAATNLDFSVHLPAGLKFNSANNRGTYEPSTHSVSWGLYELPAGQTAPMEITVLPVELGAQVISFAAKGDLGITAETKGQVNVDGLPELAYTIGQDNGTIEVGASTTYSVQITNVGNKSDRQVQLAVELPPGTELLAVDAPVDYRVSGNQIGFAPLAEMANKDQYTYRFQVRHNQPGTQIVRTKLTSENWPVAVVKEEGTLVYNDQN